MRKTPPSLPMSSPMTSTLSSSAIARRRPSFTAFAIVSPAPLALGAAIAAGILAGSRMSPGRLWVSLRPFLVLLVLVGAVNLLVVREGATLLAAGPPGRPWLTVTDQGVRVAALYVCRLALVLALGAAVLRTTVPAAMADAVVSVLSPLRRLGVHGQELGLVLTLALRFLPTLASEVRAVREAQTARGGSVETGPLRLRLKAMESLVVPAFAATLRHADRLSLALQARCTEAGTPRTRWHAPHLRGPDVLFATATALGVTALVLLGVLN